MNPTKCLRASAALLSVIVLNSPLLNAYANAADQKPAEVSVSASSSEVENQGSEMVLEDLVVHRDAELRGVRYEADDTLSLLTTNQFETFKAINSGPGAAVNFDIFFARKSVVMTADGYDTLEQMALALVYMEDGAGLELQVQLNDQSSRSLAERRAREVLSLLQGRYGVRLNIDVSYLRQDKRYSNQKTGPKAPDLFPLTLVNLGNVTANNR